MTPYQVPISTRIPRGSIEVPGSKSLSIRDLALAAIAHGTTNLRGYAVCDDVDRMIAALKLLGVDVQTTQENSLHIVGGQGALGHHGSKKSPPVTIDLGLSGTSARLLLALVALRNGTTTIDGAPPLRVRPLTYLADALVELGVLLDGPKPGYLPITVHGASSSFFSAESSSVSSLTMRGDVSSQFFSALLLIAPSLPEGLTINVAGPLVSLPYIKLTIEEMRRFGVTVHHDSGFGWFRVEKGAYRNGDVDVEADASGASYFFALATIHGGNITIPRLGSSSLQGDLGFTQVMEKLGAQVTIASNSISIQGPKNGELAPLTEPIDFTSMPDVAPTLMAIAPLIPGRTKLVGLSTLRFKECDRIACPALELKSLGVDVVEGPDWIEIPYTESLAKRSSATTQTFAPVNTYHDHRMAMSFGVLGTKVGGISIADPKVVEKTFPNFWSELISLL